RIVLFTRICDAVQHAHQRGVIHRDLKPANILVVEGDTSRSTAGASLAPGTASAGDPDPRPLSPQPKILDFGVARAITGNGEMRSVHTQVGQIVGTIQYMSPEQVAGDPNAVDVRSDVYTLGVLLMELLAGRLPHDFESRSLPECARIIRD